MMHVARLNILQSNDFEMSTKCSVSKKYTIVVIIIKVKIMYPDD